MYLKTTIEAPAAFISCNEYRESLRKYITAEEENDILSFLEILSTIQPSGSITCSGIPAGFFRSEFSGAGPAASAAGFAWSTVIM